MQGPERFSNLPEYAFPRLRALLDHHAPGGAVVAMTIGEPRHEMPPFLDEVLQAHTHLFAKYPVNEGIPELLDAISAWLGRRYGVALPQNQIMALNGTREGLFNAALALCPEQKERPTSDHSNAEPVFTKSMLSPLWPWRQNRSLCQQRRKPVICPIMRRLALTCWTVWRLPMSARHQTRKVLWPMPPIGAT